MDESKFFSTHTVSNPNPCSFEIVLLMFAWCTTDICRAATAEVASSVTSLLPFRFWPPHSHLRRRSTVSSVSTSMDDKTEVIGE